MKTIAYTIALTAFALAAFSVMLAARTAHQQICLYNNATDYPDFLLAHSYAVLSTLLELHDKSLSSIALFLLALLTLPRYRI